MVTTTKMKNGHHILYDPDGSEFEFTPGGIGSVEKYLAKGFTVKPPSKESAASVRKEKAKADARKVKAQYKAKAVAEAAQAKALADAKAEVEAEEKANK